MNKIRIQGFENYLISILLHLILLFVLALAAVPAPEAVRELVIEWFTTRYPQEIDEDFAPQGVSNLSTEKGVSASGPVTAQPNSGPLEADEISPVPEVGTSIDQPNLRPSSRINRAPALGSSSSSLAGTSNLSSGGGEGSAGYSLEAGDGDVRVMYKVIPKLGLGDYGEVILTFGIKADGSVNANSVRILRHDMNDTYVNESIKALRQWRFSVNRQNSTKIYRITFRFIPE